ncbi:hypothetical protein SEPCBS119000_000828 [Sporothrix epigloea]|uniref:Uncharacterized protein n=1 Tax=Sporothrix epigloea TaxID=1892477 RepID=A0ABP0D8W1_9PEZI
MDFQTRTPEQRQSEAESSTSIHHLHPSFSHSDGLDVYSNGALGGMGAGNDMGGMGNLADELADAFSDEDEYYDDDEVEARSHQPDEELGGHDGGDVPPDISLPEARTADDDISQNPANGADQPQRASGGYAAMPTSPRSGGPANGQARLRNGSLALPSANGGNAGSGGRRGHKRIDSVYDGSEYGSDSDLESSGMPMSLVAKIDAVESLARRGTEDNGSPADGVCKRLVEELRDLGSQSTVEGGASRLITAHSALTTHLAHQTRQLHALAFPLFSPHSGAVPLPMLGIAVSRSGVDGTDDDENESEDDILPMLASLGDQMPRPSTAACQSLGALHGVTNDLVSTLNYLSDTLHMARQTTNTATRRLRSAKELVAELRRDEELREEGERWLARGNWNERLEQRECAHVCGDVVGGFEKVCDGWRARLLAQAEAAQASA